MSGKEKMMTIQIAEMAEKMFIQNVMIWDIKKKMGGVASEKDKEQIIEDLAGLTKACLFSASVFAGLSHGASGLTDSIGKDMCKPRDGEDE